MDTVPDVVLLPHGGDGRPRTVVGASRNRTCTIGRVRKTKGMPTQAQLAREVEEALVPRGKVHLLTLRPQPCDAAGDLWLDAPDQATHVQLNQYHACHIHGRVRTSCVLAEVTCKVCLSHTYPLACPPDWMHRRMVAVEEWNQRRYARFW